MSLRRVVLQRAAILSLALAALAAAPLRSAAAQQGIAVGATAPVVTVNDLDGKPVNLGSYIGKKPVLLEFWATWCTLCEEMLPRIKAAHAAYGDRVEFVGINVTVNQTPARVRRYLESHQPPYRTLYDDQGTSIRAYQVPTTSYIVVVDRAGKVAYAGTGGEQNLEPVLKQVTSR
jgi:thiol-disulfide isomerase/thioredoxin